MTDSGARLQAVRERYADYAAALERLESFNRDYNRAKARGEGGLSLISRKTKLKQALAGAYETLRDAVFVADLLSYDKFSDEISVVEAARRATAR